MKKSLRPTPRTFCNKICPARKIYVRGQNTGLTAARRGNTFCMREIGKGLAETKSRVEKLVGVPLLMKVSEGRGKSKLLRGSILKVFPAVFTVQLENGETRTFSYSDVHTRGILFLDE